MKTTVQLSKTQQLKRIGLLVVAVTMLILSSGFNKQDGGNKKLISEKEIELNLKLNKGSYLASEFLKFKKENLIDDLYAEKQVSDKVLFKAFVKSERKKQLD